MYYGKISIALHNTILLVNEEDQLKKVYIHHTSDNKKHNAKFVNYCVKDIMPLTGGKRTIVLLPDNCSAQYKCVGFFNFMLVWASTYDIEVIKTYGVAGHGKSEIDSAGGPLTVPWCKWYLSGTLMGL